MTLPITGPYSVDYETPPGATYRFWKLSRSWSRQKAPFNLPLPFDFYEEKVDSVSALPHYQAVNSTGNISCIPFARVNLQPTYLAASIEYAKRTARSKFNAKVRPDGSELAVAYVERRKTMATLANRSLNLAAFFTLVKKNPLRAFRYIVPKYNRNMWKRIKYSLKTKVWKEYKRGARPWADAWLELSFGIIPTISDIFGAVAVLGAGVPPAQIRERGSFPLTILTGAKPSGAWNLGVTGVHATKVSVTCGAEISVSNPNLWLANQLGLVNPASVLLELTPWSFVADYLINISDFLEQFTEHWGLNVSNPYYTVYVKDVVSMIDWRTNGSGILSVNSVGKSTGVSVKRYVGALPAIKLGLRKPWTLSVRRASTSIALLLQKLPR